MSSPLLHEAPRGLSARLSRTLGLLVVLAFLLVNLVTRAHALHASGPASWDGFLAGVALGATLCLMRPGWLGPALLLFGASFFPYGFHPYRPQSQAFELLVTALALVLLLRLTRGSPAVSPPARQVVPRRPMKRESVYRNQMCRPRLTT